MIDPTTKRIHHNLVDAISPPMFAISLLFLAMIATLIVLWVDVPRVDQPSELATGVQPTDSLANSIGQALVYGCLLLWPVFWIDFAVARLLCPPEYRRWRDGFLVCLIPPLRLGARNPEIDSKIWLPVWTWCEVDDNLRKRLRKAFGGPMIVIALMILPILLVEFTMQGRVASTFWLRVLLHVGTGTIWFAFAFEFIVMYSVADKKIAYCKDHWLDLVIILLPLVSFLRSLRAIRAMRLAKLAKVQQLSRMGRIYRLRGLAVKAFRAMLLFEIVYRLTGVTPQKRLDRLQLLLEEKQVEVEEIREQIEALETLIMRQESDAEPG
jgi:voltage-gated potassium channel